MAPVNDNNATTDSGQFWNSNSSDTARIQQQQHHHQSSVSARDDILQSKQGTVVGHHQHPQQQHQQVPLPFNSQQQLLPGYAPTAYNQQFCNDMSSAAALYHNMFAPPHAFYYNYYNSNNATANNNSHQQPQPPQQQQVQYNSRHTSRSNSDADLYQVPPALGWNMAGFHQQQQQQNHDQHPQYEPHRQPQQVSNVPQNTYESHGFYNNHNSNRAPELQHSVDTRYTAAAAAATNAPQQVQSSLDILASLAEASTAHNFTNQAPRHHQQQQQASILETELHQTHQPPLLQPPPHQLQPLPYELQPSQNVSHQLPHQPASKRKLSSSKSENLTNRTKGSRSRSEAKRVKESVSSASIESTRCSDSTVAAFSPPRSTALPPKIKTVSPFAVIGETSGSSPENKPVTCDSDLQDSSVIFEGVDRTNDCNLDRRTNHTDKKLHVVTTGNDGKVVVTPETRLSKSNEKGMFNLNEPEESSIAAIKAKSKEGSSVRLEKEETKAKKEPKGGARGDKKSLGDKKEKELLKSGDSEKEKELLMPGDGDKKEKKAKKISDDIKKEKKMKKPSDGDKKERTAKKASDGDKNEKKAKKLSDGDKKAKKLSDGDKKEMKVRAISNGDKREKKVKRLSDGNNKKVDGKSSDKATKANKVKTGLQPAEIERPVSPPLPPWRDTRPAWSQQSPSAHFSRSCYIHCPTLDELKSQSFSDYVRKVVLNKAMVYETDSSDSSVSSSSEKEANTTSDKNSGNSKAQDKNGNVKTESKATTCKHVNKPVELHQGMAKVSLPIGFWEGKVIGRDSTGRGPLWEKGAPLGDMTVTTPIQQNLRGIGGVYEFMFTDQNAVSLADFRERADKYRREQVGTAYPEEDYCDEAVVAKLEEKFWKRLGPTMPPAWYGADQEGTLFGDDSANGWSVGQLDTCLHVLSYVPGVTSPYLYAGMWASVFCAHTEDMNLLSINYLHAGAPKLWYAIAPGPDAERFNTLAEFNFSHQARKCKEFLRHKQCLISPKLLQRAGIDYTTCIQMPGDAVITFPGGYHFGFNAGFNLAEATNFGVPEWLPYGRAANVCLCRPDSVRIDMNRLEFLLARFELDKKDNPTITWKQWAEEKDVNKLKKLKRSLGRSATSSSKAKKVKRKIPLSEQERRKEFWVEVMTPISADERKKAKILRQKELAAVRARIEAVASTPVTPKSIVACTESAANNGDTSKVNVLKPSTNLLDDSLKPDNATSTTMEDVSIHAELAVSGSVSLTLEEKVDETTTIELSLHDAAPAVTPDLSLSDKTTQDVPLVKIAVSTDTADARINEDSGPTAKCTPDNDTKPVENDSGKRRRKPSYKLQVLMQEEEEAKAPKPKPVANTKAVAKTDPSKLFIRRKKSRRRRRAHEGPEKWHLAKPVTRKGISLHERILVMLPGTQLCGEVREESDNILNCDDFDEDEADEECFRGEVTEIADGYVRIHLDGLSKLEDVWMPIESMKLYIDGGQWEEIIEDVEDELPPLHYWHEMDSKRRCKD